jgi:hypothetical protein
LLVSLAYIWFLCLGYLKRNKKLQLYKFGKFSVSISDLGHSLSSIGWCFQVIWIKIEWGIMLQQNAQKLVAS